MLITDIDNWEKRARAQFSYQPDVGVDTWLSHADDVLNFKPWSDDCDGLAETILDLCVRAGLPKENAYRLVVLDSQNGLGHMVGNIFDDKAVLWCVGDTFFQAPYRADRMLHKPVRYNRLSETVWRAGAPWTLEP